MLKATRVDSIDSDAGMAAGAIEFRAIDGEVWGAAFRCPCGCGHESYMNFRTSHDPNGWTFNGDQERPTTTPSVLQSGLPCKWHGYLTDGEWRPC